jgi:cytochrome c553
MWRVTLLLALAALPVSAALADETVRANYLLACRGCHLEDGGGVPPEVPSLVGTLGSLAATAPGREYLIRVPGVARSRLNDQELAAVLNWVLSEFNAASLPEDFEPFTAAEVAAARPRSIADPAAYRRRLVEGSIPE